MKYQIITIGHEYGSGGRDIGKLLAEKLGYKYYDSEITAKLAQESGYATGFVKENSEYANTTSSFIFGLNNWANGMVSISDKLFIMQRNLIVDLVTREPCVIVGHCSDYILEDFTNCFRLYLHAPIEQRAKRVNEKYHEQLENPIKELDKRDKKRKTYYRYYTNKKIDNLSNYNLTLDTSNYTDEDCANLIYDILTKAK